MTDALLSRHPHRPDNDAEHANQSTLTLFSFLWAAFTMFHQGKGGGFGLSPLSVIQTICAALVLARPGSLGLFLSLVIVQSAYFLDRMPDITNHAVFAMLVDLTILASVVIELLRGRGASLTGERLYRAFAPAVRVEVLVLYFYVVLHKLNRDFFDPEISCAVEHYRHLDWVIARVTGGMRLISPEHIGVAYALIAITLLVEAAIPLLFLHRRTRTAGILLGLLFHYVLGVNVFFDFSSMVFALYLLFAPPTFAVSLAAWWERSPVRSWVGRFRTRRIPTGAWSATALVIVVLAMGNTWRNSHRAFAAAWTLYGLVVTLVFIATIRWRRRTDLRDVWPQHSFHMAWALVPLVLLAVLNGLCPYLGLKTKSSFAMFSNLRTEGPASNHLFIPAATKIFGYQDDIVRITASNDPVLAGVAERGTLVPFFFLRDHLSRLRRAGQSGVNVTFVRDCVTHEVRNAEADRALSPDYPWLLRKTQLFAEIDPRPRQRCRH